MLGHNYKAIKAIKNKFSNLTYEVSDGIVEQLASLHSLHVCHHPVGDRPQHIVVYNIQVTDQMCR